MDLMLQGVDEIFRDLGLYLYRFTPVSRMRSKHPALLGALELNLSLTVDSSGASLLGSTEIGNA